MARENIGNFGLYDRQSSFLTFINHTLTETVSRTRCSALGQEVHLQLWWRRKQDYHVSGASFSLQFFVLTIS